MSWPPDGPASAELTVARLARSRNEPISALICVVTSTTRDRKREGAFDCPSLSSLSLGCWAVSIGSANGAETVRDPA